MSKKSLATPLLANLKNYLKNTPYAHYSLKMLKDEGLAHWHCFLKGSDKILRIPKQSQMNLSIKKNLIYEATCYKTAHPSGVTPKFFEILFPHPLLPKGALVVEKITGEKITLKKDLKKLALSLSKLHTLQTPKGFKKNKIILYPSNPLKLMILEIQNQKKYLNESPTAKKVQAIIEEQYQLVLKKIENINFKKLPTSFIAFDTHPGNFIIPSNKIVKKAILVDLEKCRYSLSGFDLAHTSLYTSTTWGKTKSQISKNSLSDKEVISFYQTWLESVPLSFAKRSASIALLLRILMWLWSVTWCGKWLIESKTSSHSLKAQNWSTDLSEDSLIKKTHFNVLDYLNEETIIKITKSWANNSPLDSFLKDFSNLKR